MKSFAKHFESSGHGEKKHQEHWKNRLIGLLESRLLEQVLHGAEGEKKTDHLAAESFATQKRPLYSCIGIARGTDGLR